MPNINSIVHVGCVDKLKGSDPYLYLCKEDKGYRWYRPAKDGAEIATHIKGSTPEEAIRKALESWDEDHFRLLHCGVRYNVDPRDEHGINALFQEMVQSYDSGTILGDYFDADCGHRCYVDFASDEALALWKKLKGA